MSNLVDAFEAECESLRAELEKARSQLVTAQWQPIETAPQDGKPFLAWWKHCKTPAVTYWEYDDLWRERKWAHKAVEQGWKSEGDNCIPINQKDCTHWMPLPPPPLTDDQGTSK